MTIAASRVKALCTPTETALVRASRKGQLENLSSEVLKKNAALAKKLADKWRDLGRDQSRVRSRATGHGEHDSNTQVKEQIFREAHTAFTAQLAAIGNGGTSAKASTKPKSKRDRNTEHRATRAAVRKGMSAVEDLLNAEKPRRAKSQPAPTPAPEPAAAPAPVAAKSAASTPAKKAKPAAARLAKATPPRPAKQGKPTVSVVEQRKALTAAKKSRLARSGKTTRLASHTKSHGKRTQARRDGKN